MTAARATRPRIALPDPTGAGSRGYRLMSMSGAMTLDRALRHRGASMDAIARELGVSRRTLYRWRGARFHEVAVAGWVATFVVRPSHAGGVPVQCTPWREVDP